MTVTREIPALTPKTGAKPRPLMMPRNPITAPLPGRRISGLYPPSKTVHEADRVVYFYPTNSAIRASRGSGGVVVSSPLQVLFWGSGWERSSTNPTMNDVANAVQAIVDSPYLSEMSQYGFQEIESVGFSWVLSDPPASYSRGDVSSIVWGLIEGGHFPEPDDPGGRIIYMVFAHPGAAYDDTEAAGAHTNAWHYDFPFDIDYAWAAWVNFGTSIDDITKVFTHELVETISDPDNGSGWITNQPDPLDEIADVCYPIAGPVEGYAASAYFSAQLGQCVVPSNGLPRVVRLSERDDALGEALVTTGETQADGHNSCFHGFYRWTLFSQAHRATVTADVSSYADPTLTWTIDGQEIFGGEKIPLTVAGPDPLSSITRLPAETTTISVELNTDRTQLTLTCPADAGTVMPAVACTVQDDSAFLGYDTKRSDSLVVAISGRTRFMDRHFFSDELTCWLSRLQPVGEVVNQVIDRGDPIPIWVERQLDEISSAMRFAAIQAARITDALAEVTHSGSPAGDATLVQSQTTDSAT